MTALSIRASESPTYSIPKTQMYSRDLLLNLNVAYGGKNNDSNKTNSKS